MHRQPNCQQSDIPLDIELCDELAASIGDTWRLYTSPGEGSSIFNSMTGVVHVKDAVRLTKLFDKLAARKPAEQSEAKDSAKDPKTDKPQPETWAVRKSRFAEHDVYYLVRPQGESPGVLTWCLVKNELVCSLSPQNVKAYLLRQPGGSSLADEPAVTEAFIPNSRRRCWCMKTPADVSHDLSADAGLRHDGGRQAGLPTDGIDPMLLPASPTIAKYLQPAVSMVSIAPKGVHLTIHQSLPNGNLGATLYVVLCSLLPADAGSCVSAAGIPAGIPMVPRDIADPARKTQELVTLPDGPAATSPAPNTGSPSPAAAGAGYAPSPAPSSGYAQSSGYNSPSPPYAATVQYPSTATPEPYSSPLAASVPGSAPLWHPPLANASGYAPSTAYAPPNAPVPYAAPARPIPPAANPTVVYVPMVIYVPMVYAAAAPPAAYPPGYALSYAPPGYGAPAYTPGSYSPPSYTPPGPPAYGNPGYVPVTPPPSGYGNPSASSYAPAAAPPSVYVTPGTCTTYAQAAMAPQAAMPAIPNAPAPVVTPGPVVPSSVVAHGPTALFFFYSDASGPSNRMEPVVQTLIARGYPVERVDVAQNKNKPLTTNYGVTDIPCFLMLVDGREASRSVGETSMSRLQQMCQAGVSTASSSAPTPTAAPFHIAAPVAVAPPAAGSDPYLAAPAATAMQPMATPAGGWNPFIATRSRIPPPVTTPCSPAVPCQRRKYRQRPPCTRYSPKRRGHARLRNTATPTKTSSSWRLERNFMAPSRSSSTLPPATPSSLPKPIFRITRRSTDISDTKLPLFDKSGNRSAA